MNDWQRFFDGYAEKYDQEVFTKNTEAETPFIIEHLCPPPHGTILDLGCGTGRHSVALARLGYRVTGVDLSAGMLALAEQRAQAASVAVEWVHANAVDFVRPDAFDAAICLCEGAVCLLAEGDDPFERDLTILRGIHSSLRIGGRLLLNVLNGYRQIRAASDETVACGRFDTLSLTECTDATKHLPEAGAGLKLRERGYTPPELRRMLIASGFSISGIYGGTAGDWGLRPPKLDEFELMALVEK